MRKSTFSRLLLFAFVSTVLFQSCKDDAFLLNPPPIPDQSITEEFDTLARAHARGWRTINRSMPLGPGDWIEAYTNFQNRPYMLAGGGALLVPPYSTTGNPSGYLMSSAYASIGATPAGSGVISNWVVSPPLTIKNGDKIIFYTTSSDSVWAFDPVLGGGVFMKTDPYTRLQVRINKHDQSLDVGQGENPGKFDLSILDINAGLQPLGYPNWNLNGWTRMEATVFGLNGPVKGRFGLRYYVPGGGSSTTEGGGVIGLDKVSFVSSPN